MIRKSYKLITPLTYEDWERFHTIRNKNFYLGIQEYNPYSNKEIKPNQIQKNLLYKNKIIGSVRIDFIEDFAIIQAFSIDPDYQKKGHGKTFIKLIEKYIKYKKVRKIKINATSKSLKFYLKQGYIKGRWPSPKGLFSLFKKL